MTTLWHGRFASGPSAALTQLNNSLPFDIRLADADIEGSISHVKGLVIAGLLNKEEGSRLLQALDVVREKLGSGSVTFLETDEDVHTVVERLVTEHLGDLGGKLHTGRSRNDQVATDLRLYLREEICALIRSITDLQLTFLQLAREHMNVYLPGYTHLQRAQAVLLSHHLAAHAWAMSRDVDRLFDAYRRNNVSVLGAGALAGSSLPLDVHGNAERLGFDAVFDNSMDAVADRDNVAEVLFAIALLGTHISRIGEEFVLWSSDEFGFVTLDDGFSTGSSMMPQKKNPDVAELARGKSGRFLGNLTGLLAALKGIPLCYNKDLQEDKEALFDSLDQMHLLLAALNGMVSTATFHAERMQAAADNSASPATDLAEWLVKQGMPFRKAHAVVGELVRRSLAEDISLLDLVRTDDRLGEQATHLLAPGASVHARVTHGAGGGTAVEDELLRLHVRIDVDCARLHALVERTV